MDTARKTRVTMSSSGLSNDDETNRNRPKHLGVIALHCVYIVAFIRMNFTYTQDPVEEYGPTIALLINIAFIAPFLTLPFALANGLGMILCNPFERPVATGTLYNAPFICFRTVTRGDFPDLVIENAISNKKTCLSSGLRNFLIEIVTDKTTNVTEDKYIRETVVPTEYKTVKRSLFKARALNYCLEADVIRLAGNDWIVHLDEESQLTEQTIIGITEFIHDNRADIGQGPINTARGEMIPSWFNTLADVIRLAWDYGLFRFQFTFLKAPIFGFKGSYIVLKNRVELDVGFDFGPKCSVTEDCYFALKAWTKGYTFGFIKGEMREQSPFSVMDHIRQRRRWFMGHVYIICDRNIPLLKRSGIILGVVCCILMPISLSTLIVNVAFPYVKPLYQSVLLGVFGGSFACFYCFGTYIALYKRHWGYPRLLTVCFFNFVVVFPMAVVLHIVAVMWGLVTLNTLEFYVVEKEIKYMYSNNKRP